MASEAQRGNVTKLPMRNPQHALFLLHPNICTGLTPAMSSYAGSKPPALGQSSLFGLVPAKKQAQI